MRIDLNRANDQARRMRLQSDRLRDARTSLLNFQRDLQHRWRGEEVALINNAIDHMQNRLTATTNETATIANEISSVAHEIRRQEDLVAAQVILRQADNNVSNLRQSFETVQRLHQRLPTSSTQRLLNDSRNRLNEALNQQSAAASRVRSLS